ncbi:MAG: YfhO family protein [candidate division WOR-3 bacterium]|nr:MAG: YfhO family protein [candidate division WOR-3 bacterium]
MSKKSKSKQLHSQPVKPFFLETHWEKFIIALLFVLPLIYFSSFLSADRMIGGSDYLIGGYPFEKWIGEQEEMPLWYPHVFGGVPVLGSPVGGPLAPLAQLREIMPPHVVLAFSLVIFLFLAGLGTYLYLKAMGLSIYTAALGAVIYQFIGNLATTPAAGHAGRAASIAMFPLILYFIHSALRSKRILFFLLAALTTAFAFYEGHFQITYYGLLFILAYVFYYLIAHRKENSKRDVIKILGYGLLTVITICLLMAAIWLPVLSGLGTAARGVERGYEYATSWAMPPLEIVDVFIPTFSGILDNYWGVNSFKIHLEYFGVIAIILAALAVVLYWRKRYVKFYSIAAFVVVLVAIGNATPFFRIPYALVPGFRLFRAPALIFYLTSFSMVVLGAVAFESIFVDKKEKQSKRLFVVVGVVVAVFLLIALVFSIGGDSLVQSMQTSMNSKLSSLWGTQAARAKLSNLRSNYPSLVGGTWRTAIFALLIAGAIYLSMKRKVKVWIFSLLLIAFALVDQLSIVSKFLPQAPAPEKYYAADDVTRFIKEDTTTFRVFPTPWYEHASDLFLLYHNLQSAGGYIPNPLKRYQEYIGAGQSVMFTPTNLVQYPSCLDMLNIKYVIAPALPVDISQYDPQVQAVITRIRVFLSRFQLVFTGRRYTVYQNQHSIPRAHLVHDYAVYEESETMNIIRSQGHDPYLSVLLEEEPEFIFSDSRDSAASDVVELLKYEPNEIICLVETESPGLLVVADNWHPDWQAFVDGKGTRVYIANHTFRAVYVSEGKHEVTMKYVSAGFIYGRIISVIALLLVVGICVIGIKFKF